MIQKKQKLKLLNLFILENLSLYFFDRILNKFLSLPFYMHQFCNIENFKKLKKADRVYLVSESTAFSILPMLVVLKVISNTKYSLFVMGLYSKKIKYKNFKKLHHLVIKILYFYLDTLYFLGYREMLIAKNFHKNNSKINYLPFSIDEKFWDNKNKLKLSDNKNIIFVGNDGNRNPKLLIDIAELYPKISFTVVSNLKQFDNLNLKNVEVLKGKWGSKDITDEDLKSLYLNSRLCLIPLHNSHQPSGQSVALQSMSLGIPVLISMTDGFWDKEFLKTEENIFLIHENTLDGWKSKIDEVYDNLELLNTISENSQNIVKKEFNLEKFTNKFLQN